jgi:hypothetical protein
MPEAPLGIYAYCVVAAGERLPLDDLSGVELIADGTLGALVRTVSLDEFGADALKRNLEDMAWLERTAFAHQAVLDRVVAACEAVVPLRLCTIFEGDNGVRAMLERDHDALAEALAEISPVALRYGARSHAIYRFNDDRYKFMQLAEFERKDQWEAYWYGPEFTDFRIVCAGWYQVPVLYGWTELVTSGTMAPEAAHRVSGEPVGAEPGGDLVG